LLTVLDGFDLTVIGVATPKIAEFLHANLSALGLAISAGQFGPLIGAVVLGMAADRFGRKWMLFASALIFGVFTLLTAFITNVEQLALYRFISGLGLGGAVPNALAFGSEYAPSRVHKTFVATMYAGAGTGATVAGLMSAYLIPHFGWQSLFIFGGIAPIVIALIAAVLLPESLEFLAWKGNKDQQMRRIIRRVAPAIAKDRDYQFIATEKKLRGVPVKHLFTGGRALMTMIFWVTMAAALYLLYLNATWAPTLLHKSGASVVQYSLAFACLNFGAVIAIVITGHLMDKGNPFRILQLLFTFSFIAFVVFGIFAGGAFITIAVLACCCGFTIGASYAGLIAVMTLSYPSNIRGTGVGWAYAMSKIGGTLSPAIGGYLLSQNWSVTGIYSTNALVAVFAIALLVVLGWRMAPAAVPRNVQTA
jgi:AAHS family 4-hydroxybenzoate transporter-like MFS transporter